MNKTKVLQFVVKYKLLEVSRRLMEWLGDFVLKKKNVKGSRVLSMKFVSLKLFTQRPRPSMIFFGKVCSTHLDSEKQNDCVSRKLIRPCVCVS